METKKCSRCRKVKSTSEFYFNKTLNHFQSHCKDCQKKQSKKWHSNIFEKDEIKSTIIKTLQSAHSNAKARKIPFAINFDYIKSLYDKQGGKCYYTNTPMTFKTKNHQERHPFLLSIDRINRAKGYVPDNIVLCCWAANSLKGIYDVKTFYYTLETFYKNSVDLLRSRGKVQSR